MLKHTMVYSSCAFRLLRPSGRSLCCPFPFLCLYLSSSMLPVFRVSADFLSKPTLAEFSPPGGFIALVAS